MQLIIFFIIFQIAIFITLAVFLRRMLNRNVVSATSHLDQLASDYAKREEEIKKQLESAKRQSQEILNNALADGQKQKEDILKKGEEEKKKIIDEAHSKADEVIEQADRARMALLGDMNNKIDEKATSQAVYLLQTSLPEVICQEMHKLWIKNLISNSFDQLTKLNVPEGCLEARIITAFALTKDENDYIRDKIKEKTGKTLAIKEEVDASLIAGVIVSIGGLVLDGSLKYKIQEVASAARSGS